MSIEADRISDLEVKVEDTLYMFDTKDRADAFLQCLGNDSLQTCTTNHAPVSMRAVTTDTGVPEGEPGSIISPSLGGMP
ncbi:hypothetical protein P9250_13215 [Caballeronia sp. LP006]|uniref:hypothetical protein n=1 Tax=unclassified Caballeronia TaxID=2646786 RepID=UPI002027DF51|nr:MULTISPECIES: hypothetical protein [unclassified Caballeronia]MDR5801687.1 hypothetical protein [Caballeronia sp. LZ001]MDR5828841.1 hypothetical protein [Caballeronia sp. LP006]